MALESGTKLGSYEIRDLLGKGGMGEVYRARDTRLGRDVAIKVLPDEFSRDAERVSRFEREARLLASLNHPNIAAIYGLENEGLRLLVLELVEGETLAERLSGGAIPVGEARQLALQLAEALEAAHDKGIVHRDLKPANIKVTPEGRVKVLDFGLAKAFVGDQENVSLSNSPTLSMAATQQGVILGTAAYMSPEQATGKESDKRTDVWSFGVVLFEMLTGRPLFEGETVTDVLAGVLRADPDWTSLPPGLHPRIRVLLERCLERNVRDRCRDMSEARVAIRKALEEPAGGVIGSPPALPSRSRAGLIAAFVLGLIVAGLAVWSQLRSDAVDPDVVRFRQVLPVGQRLAQNPLLSETPLDVAPNGSRIVYAANQQLYVRELGDFEASPVPGSRDNPRSAVFSPDSQWIAYWSQATEELRKIPAVGGASELITGLPGLPLIGGPVGISWDQAETLLYATIEGIWSVPAGGGDPVLELPAQEGRLHLLPQRLPGQAGILYSEHDFESQRSWIAVAPPANDAEPVTLFEGARARYLDTGHLVYVRGETLYGTTFDPMTLDIGPQAQLVDDVSDALYTVSDDGGTLVYASLSAATTGDAPGARTILWLSPEGREQPIPVDPGDWEEVRVSPGGTHLALRAADGEVYTWRVGAGPLRGVGSSLVPPVWLSDGELALAGPEGIYRRPLASSAVDLIAAAETLAGLLRISSVSSLRNALLLEFQGTRSEIQLLSLDSGALESVIDGELLGVSDAQMSPDESYMVVLESPDGLMIREFPDVQAGRTPAADGIRPLWKDSGIYYWAEGSIWLLPVETSPELLLGAPRQVAGTAGYRNLVIGHRSWDVAPDGRLAAIKLPEDTAGPQISPANGPVAQRISIVVNFDQELRERLAAP